jgi:glycosyltransferase involved in cell wall biosynthesis
MKKVLIISYRFHQKEKIGAVRIRGLAKFLPEFGWEPIILTEKYQSQQDDAFSIIETDEWTFWKKIKPLSIFQNDNISSRHQIRVRSQKSASAFIFLFNIIQEVFTFPTMYSIWARRAFEKGYDLLNQEPIDAIISSSSPVSTHLIARCLKERTHIPWVADFRDPWTQNHYYHYSNLRKKIERNLEIKTISAADHLVSVSEHFCEKLGLLHKNKEISIIYNGYDPDDLQNTEKISGKFSITYTGNIYSGSQDPDPLFRALRELLAHDLLDTADLEVNFYGGINRELSQNVQKYNLQNYVKFHGTVSREDALKSQKTSQLLLLLSWNDLNEKGVIPAKIYEYLAAKRPILSIGNIGGGEVRLILERTNSGVDLTEIEEIKQKLLLAYSEFKNQGYVKYSGIQEEIEKFSQREMARKYSEVLNRIIRE